MNIPPANLFENEDGMNDLLSILRSAEHVMSNPSDASGTRFMSDMNSIRNCNTVAGFHPSMIPFPDPIPTQTSLPTSLLPTMKQAPTTLPSMSRSFPKPMGKLTARQITPDAEESLVMSGGSPSFISFPKPLARLSSRHITPDGVEFFDQATTMARLKRATGPSTCSPLPSSVNTLPVKSSSASLCSMDSFSTLIFDDDVMQESVQPDQIPLRKVDIFSFPVEDDEDDDFMGPLPLDMVPASTRDISFTSPQKPSPIPQYALSSFGCITQQQQAVDTPALAANPNKARPQRYQQGAWNRRLEELREFKKEHGHAMVPHLYKKNPQLSQWVKRQRYQYRLKKMDKHSTLSDDREAHLTNMGFVFESHKTSWNESFTQLKAFYLQHGHSRVTKTNAAEELNTWAKHQRRQYKRFVCGQLSHMTLERIQKLESLQFDWDPRNILAGGR